MATLTALGQAIPAGEQHAVSVSLPTWKDVTGYELGERRVIDAMQIGYPRFFIHKRIQRLSRWVLQKYGAHDECCYLFPSRRTANACVDFLAAKSPSIAARVVEMSFHDQDRTLESCNSDIPIYAVLLPQANESAGKEYWQHTGDGISSRRADRCLQALQPNAPAASTSTGGIIENPKRSADVTSGRGFGRNKHYSRASSVHTLESLSQAHTRALNEENGPECDPSAYVEERYGRNLTKKLAPLAKNALKRRIAGVLNDQPESCQNAHPQAKLDTSLRHMSLEAETAKLTHLPQNTPSSRGVSNLSEDDVYLYPTGMSAIFHAHMTVLRTAARQSTPIGKSVCFGFPYTDTLKILEKWGPGCHHYGNGTDQDLDDLEAMLAEQEKEGVDPRIIALHTEFPSNPLLRTADLPRLRQLADKHNFLIVVDETIGTFANVEILPYVDIAVSSLTKIFSGDCNVMGGSMVLNPQGRHYESLKATLADDYEDNMFEDDAVFVERNSRDYKSRIVRIDRNAERLCEYLKQELECNNLAKIHFPKYTTPEHYAKCLRKHDMQQHGAQINQPGYGGLFSVTFSDQNSAQAFFDNLACEKGPSLGTNFTLACPYTILAHFNELDWTQKWGVPENLVRVSVGLEDFEELLQSFAPAVKACQDVQ